MPETEVQSQVMEGHSSLDEAAASFFGVESPISETTPTAQSDAGQASEAPGIREGDGTGETAGNAGESPQGQVSSEVSDDDIMAALSPTETPEQEIARIKREAGASREEALRLKKVESGLNKVLEEQGLQVVTDESGQVVGVAPTKKYNNGKAEKALSMKFSDFSEDQQSEFESDPQALIDHVLGHARKGMARVAPTVAEPVASLSPEAELATYNHLESLVTSDGETKKHPNIVENKKFIQQQLSAPSNKALREFYYQQPELAVSLLDSWVDKGRILAAGKAQAIAKQQKLKQQEADSTLSTAPTGGGVPSLSTGSSIEDQQAYWNEQFRNM